MKSVNKLQELKDQVGLMH